MPRNSLTTETQIEAMDSSNINAEDIDQDLNEKLRGDAVGETMYSASFITKTLLQLSDVKWTKQLEEDLCFLWDMTLEKDVSNYLLELDFPTIVCEILNQKQENRLVEILIGILANIFSVVNEPKMSEDEIDVILLQLISDDPLILIQVMRFLKAVAYQYEKAQFVNRDIIGQISFILRSSTNIELLTNTLDTLTKLTEKDKIESDLLRGDIVPDIITGLNEIKGNNDLGNSEVRIAYVHVMQIMCNLCVYAEEPGSILLDELKSYSHMTVCEFSHILKYFSQEENLLPVPKELNFYVDALTYIFETLALKNFQDIFESMCKITFILIKEKYEEISSYLGLICFMISKGNLEDLQHSVPHISSEMLHCISKNCNEVSDDVHKKMKLLQQFCIKRHKR